MICQKHTIKINIVSEFKVKVYFLSFWIRFIKSDFDRGQVDRNTSFPMYILEHCVAIVSW